MSVIQATSAGVKDMADGTLRITFEFDPLQAKEAYALFGARGTQVAVAALTLESTLAQAQNEAINCAPEKNGGALSVWLALRCKEKIFCRFIEHINGYDVDTIDSVLCDELVKYCIEIESKKELDHDAEAAKRFHEKIRLPYSEWLIGRSHD